MASVALAFLLDPLDNLQARPTVYKSGTLTQCTGQASFAKLQSLQQAVAYDHCKGAAVLLSKLNGCFGSSRKEHWLHMHFGLQKMY
jgi:hypothetical protein